MRYLYITLLVVCLPVLTLSGELQPQPDICHFINGDKLSGKLLAFSTETGIQWQSPASTAPMNFLPETVDEIQLSPEPDSETNFHNALIEVSNGDSIPARLVKMDSEGLQIETTYAGPITLDPAMVTTILPRNEGSGVILNGIGSLDDWELPTGAETAWDASRGILKTTQPTWISRKLQLPDQCSIEFTAEWATAPNFRFSFMMNDPERADRECYNLTVQPTYIRLYRRDKTGRTSSLSNQFFRIRPSSESRFQILINRKLGTIMLYIDQQHILTGRDTSEHAGNGIQFRNSMPQSFRISNLRVSHHSGKSTVKSDEEPATGQDVIYLANGDRIAGDITGLPDDKISVKTTFTEMNVPLTRVTRILFDSETRAHQRRNRRDIRGHMSDEGNITLRLDRIENGEITGYSENYGDVSTSLRRFRTLNFNLYRPERAVAE